MPSFAIDRKKISGKPDIWEAWEVNAKTTEEAKAELSLPPNADVGTVIDFKLDERLEMLYVALKGLNPCLQGADPFTELCEAIALASFQAGRCYGETVASIEAMGG